MARLTEAVGASVHVKATTGERHGVRRPRGRAWPRWRWRPWSAPGSATWSAETVEALAPDAASVTAARKLARPGPWSEHGSRRARGLGAVQGQRRRGRTRRRSISPGPAFKCSCPSRKFPCKHALALLLLRAADAVPAGAPPDVGGRVAGLAGASAARAASRPAPGEPPRDPEAAAKRAAEREARVAGGVEDLQRWLRDAVRGGLGAGRLRTWDEWDAFAARLVDAQAPGAAARLRSLGGVAAGRPDGWPERLLSGLGAAAPAVRGARARRRAGARRRPRAAGLERRARGGAGRAARRGSLGGARADRDRAGAPARPAHVALGARAGRPALLLDFAPPGAPLEPRPAPGMAMTAVARVPPGRDAAAGARRRRPGAARARPGRLRRAAARTRRCGRSRARSPLNPWLEEWPVVLAAAVPDGRDGGPWTREHRRTARCRLGGPRTPAGACWRSPAGARSRSSASGTATP